MCFPHLGLQNLQDTEVWTSVEQEGLVHITQITLGGEAEMALTKGKLFWWDLFSF